MEDKHEIALRLYESTVGLYQFAFKTIISIAAGYLAGSGLLFAFYVSHNEHRLLLLLPAFAGFGLSIVCFITAWFTRNLDEMFSGPLETLKFSVSHENFVYMFPAHQPLTALCIGIGVITATVGLQCLYFGEFYPKKIDHASQTILVAVLAIAISRIFDHFKKARNRTE